MKYTSDAFSHMEQRYRARFINSLSGFKSANLVGTTDKNGQHNLSIVSSVFHLGANPALMGFIIRPSNAQRHTLDNILETQSFTINSVNNAIYHAAHQASARFPKHVSEFEMTGLTPYLDKGIEAPFVAESPIKIGLELREHQTLSVNKTEMIIGEITMVDVDTRAIMSDGYIDIESLGLISVSGLDSYHSSQRLARLSYAKPNKVAHELTRQGVEK